MLSIVIDDKIPFIKGVLEPYAQVRYLPGQSVVKEHLLDADALIVRTRTSCNAQLLEGTRVKLIVSATIGFDHIDVNYCNANGISWTNAAGSNAASVEQYVLAALLELAHRFSFSLNEKTIGIVGVGNVGSRVAKVARLLGMRVLLCDPPRAEREGSKEFLSLSQLAKEAAIISFHPALTREGAYPSNHLANSDFFSSLKQGAIIINSSRGEVIDEHSLAIALKEKRVSAAVLDVWENEPAIDSELLSQAAIATPHIAGYSTDGKANATAMSVVAVARFFNLPLEGWRPQQLPLPDVQKLRVASSAGQPFQDTLRYLLTQTYSIMVDDAKLRQSPSSFEQQRGSYPVRREPSSFSIDSHNFSAEELGLLKGIGFNIL